METRHTSKKLKKHRKIFFYHYGKATILDYRVFLSILHYGSYQTEKGRIAVRISTIIKYANVKLNKKELKEVINKLRLGIFYMFYDGGEGLDEIIYGNSLFSNILPGPGAEVLLGEFIFYLFYPCGDLLTYTKARAERV